MGTADEYHGEFKSLAFVDGHYAYTLIFFYWDVHAVQLFFFVAKASYAVRKGCKAHGVNVGLAGKFKYPVVEACVHVDLSVPHCFVAVAAFVPEGVQCFCYALRLGCFGKFFVEFFCPLVALKALLGKD